MTSTGNNEVVSYRNFVGGEWVDYDRQPIDVISSATGEVIATVPDGHAPDIAEAVKAALTGFDVMRRLTPSQRSRMLLDFAEAIDNDADYLADLEAKNTGRNRDAALMEVAHSSDTMRFFAGATRNLEGKAAGEYAQDRTSFIRRDPIGVCGQITPWNYPMMMAALAIGPALAGGNATILKPSELTPLTSLRLAELAAGIFPNGALNVVTGYGKSAGDALVRHDDIALVSLIGDVKTGKLITQNSADSLKRLHLELGGNAPVIIYDDADVDLAVNALRVGTYWNAGQDCTAATRIMVQKGLYERFVEAFVNMVESLKVGEPDVSGVEMGPVISEVQRNRVLGFVERAAKDGAEIATGGMATGDRGFFVKPTVIVNPAQHSEIVQREVFGPVATVQSFADEAEALTWANDTDYGLTASVWSRGAGKLFRAARDLNFGTVWLNDHFTMAAEMPHGGMKKSGHGKDQSMYSLEDYTMVKHVMLNIAAGDN